MRKSPVNAGLLSLGSVVFSTVKRRKLKWYGQVFCSSGLTKTILPGTVKGGRGQGRQKKKWEDNIGEMDRPGVRQVPEGSGEQGKMEETGCEINRAVKG